MTVRDQVIAEILAKRDAGVLKTDDDYGLDSLAKLDVVSFLEGVKANFLDNCFDAVADAVSLNEIMLVFNQYALAEAA